MAKVFYTDVRRPSAAAMSNSRIARTITLSGARPICSPHQSLVRFVVPSLLAQFSDEMKLKFDRMNRSSKMKVRLRVFFAFREREVDSLLQYETLWCAQNQSVHRIC